MLLAAVFASPWVCQSQNLIDANSTVIINNSDYRIHYELKQGQNGAWNRISLDPGYKQTYRINREENLYIQVCTSTGDGQNGKNCVSYRLEQMKRYQLYWNDKERRWDVAEISNE